MENRTKLHKCYQGKISDIKLVWKSIVTVVRHYYRVLKVDFHHFMDRAVMKLSNTQKIQSRENNTREI